jgi:hypothetical protein
MRALVALTMCVGAWAAAPGAAQPCDGQWLPGDGVPGVNGHVGAMVYWDPDGPGPMPPVLVVGGSFNVAGDSFVSNIAAWDGTTWSALGTGLNGEVFALAAR